jgi:hypothetical protein
LAAEEREGAKEQEDSFHRGALEITLRLSNTLERWARRHGAVFRGDRDRERVLVAPRE